MSEKTVFERLAALDVGKHVEKKGKFSYLSWPWAVKTLREAAPDATWEVIKYDGKPYCATETGYFVEVAVTVNGITLSQIHPVLDNNNKTIAVPNAFQINTSIQRCLVKAIALHGLGLYIYAGEDLPEVEPHDYIDDFRPAAAQGSAALMAAFNEHKSEPGFKEWWAAHSKELKETASSADQMKEAA